MPRKFWNPSSWVSLVPNGLGQVKPHHYWEMLKIAWENRDQLPYAWRILTRGVCDGCALGTTGMRDFTMSGVHLCLVRLNLLRLNTAPALDMQRLEEVSILAKKDAKELRELGRLPYPAIRKKGEYGFKRLSWEEAFRFIAERIRETDPQRLAFYLTSRGLTNEIYYVAQKVARFLGTNNIDNSARICHAPSTVALKQMLGVAASTCSYQDWLGTDLLVFIGSDTPNNQPVTTKYMYYAKKQGTKIAVINPYREPGLERYWVPSVFESALFGTKLADAFFQIHIGGDIAFLNGVMKTLIERDWIDAKFIRGQCAGFAELKAGLAEQSWEMLEKSSGASREEMLRFAEMLAKAQRGIFVWSMGITQHANGVENVKAIINLCLARGFIGRPKCGLMAIRGHSGVQGGAEVGCVPNQFPGGLPVNEENAQHFAKLWGFAVPSTRGLNAVEMIDAAHEGKIDLLYSAGGNFLETLPEPDFVREALLRVPLRVHQDIVLSPPMLLDPADTVILLPAQTRYEQKGGGTETSTERMIYFSPEIPGRRIGEAKSEWEIFMELAEHVHPQRSAQIHFENAKQIRDEIARAVPFYNGIQYLKKPGDAVQWGGIRLCDGPHFKTADGKAHFAVLTPPERKLAIGQFFVTTRRGKQFNSMVLSEYDPLTGGRRDDVFMSQEDATALGLSDGAPVVLKNDLGEFNGRVKIAPLRPGNLQVHWPEGNHLIRRGVCDPLCGIPDYNTVVEVVKTTVTTNSVLEKSNT
ncbi:MAG: FdhF/YdeP family oxidoreductase [candidate division KSB1 bacterium]|nr:FdhF/YdeP family oxidoreductase [candidate division KSB1 bacterium]MDZ7365582.1 FdhF/YdeP family oxidoreductase [candidate division KSB1 bacterium]MDZ7403684.1 FdhF/YdeP family oxidoreductase [candidate division KSB1 bacterium]